MTAIAGCIHAGPAARRLARRTPARAGRAALAAEARGRAGAAVRDIRQQARLAPVAGHAVAVAEARRAREPAHAERAGRRRVRDHRTGRAAGAAIRRVALEPCLAAIGAHPVAVPETRSARKRAVPRGAPSARGVRRRRTGRRGVGLAVNTADLPRTVGRTSRGPGRADPVAAAGCGARRARRAHDRPRAEAVRFADLCRRRGGAGRGARHADPHPAGAITAGLPLGAGHRGVGSAVGVADPTLAVRPIAVRDARQAHWSLTSALATGLAGRAGNDRELRSTGVTGALPCRVLAGDLGRSTDASGARPISAAVLARPAVGIRDALYADRAPLITDEARR